MQNRLTVNYTIKSNRTKGNAKLLTVLERIIDLAMSNPLIYPLKGEKKHLYTINKKKQLCHCTTL